MTNKVERALAQRYQEESLEELVIRLNQPEPFPSALIEGLEEEWALIIQDLKAGNYEAVTDGIALLVRAKKLTREDGAKLKVALKPETITLEELQNGI